MNNNNITLTVKWLFPDIRFINLYNCFVNARLEYRVVHLLSAPTKRRNYTRVHRQKQRIFTHVRYVREDWLERKDYVY